MVAFLVPDNVQIFNGIRSDSFSHGFVALRVKCGLGFKDIGSGGSNNMYLLTTLTIVLLTATVGSTSGK